jgi:hypothetical protein
VSKEDHNNESENLVLKSSLNNANTGLELKEY